MMTAPMIKVEYVVEPDEDEGERKEQLPEVLRKYFEELRRAHITQIRALDKVLGLEPTIPERQRPH